MHLFWDPFHKVTKYAHVFIARLDIKDFVGVFFTFQIYLFSKYVFFILDVRDQNDGIFKVHLLESDSTCDIKEWRER